MTDQGPGTLPTAHWAAHDGVPLLRTLAEALLVLDEQTGLQSFTLPYPAEAQRALDRTALACLLRGARPPAGLTELVDRCRTVPLEDWPLSFPPDLVGPGDRLLDEVCNRPTELCHEWAGRSPDSAAVFRDREIVLAALRLCREYGEEDAYTAFRRLLVHRPVLTTAEMYEVTGDMVLEPVHELIRRIYKPVPDSYLRDGTYTACERCLTLLTPVRTGEWWCERDRCRRQGPPPPGRRFAYEAEGALSQLERPLRQFVTGSGRAEADLERELLALGLEVRMWPGYDAYDLQVVFPDGWRWAVDVKDWAHPTFLGRSARPVPQDPPYDEAFWSVPRYRVTARPGYVAAFERARPESAGDLQLLTDTELVTRAKRRLRASKGDRRA
ncbi:MULTISPECIES: hypothetical protein [Streptomyces rochei group]|uniref:REase associating with pPIWI RE domain-containing protein n=1 Tax=Streptomyces plicatus TaxID=1922 RepID=A0ABW1Y345_STRPL|nr:MULTISPECIES: hypothetical protein [Streptomyces rochei group]GGZ46515.1 hypothetical protein GCM10010301_18670 [Streptomyces plicatus]GHC03370.1 hypothetical protein GCM10010308_14840 [Streptomyces vinaceusdrappus]